MIILNKYLILAVSFVLLLSACGTTSKTVALEERKPLLNGSEQHENRPITAQTISLDKPQASNNNNALVTDVNTLDKELVYLTQTFLGTPYKYGGTSEHGMDCSGLIYTVFKMKDIIVPRTSRDLAKYGVKIQTKDSKPGDLIFFKTSSRNVISHVGIVSKIMDGEIFFIHASTQRGVIESSLSESYYKKAFVQINQVLE